jgi:hypothetical protein
VILDTSGNLSGGFIRVEWGSRNWNGKQGKDDTSWKADPVLKSFLFALKNPHNFPARRLALRAEKKNWAIWCFVGQCVPPFDAARRDVKIVSVPFRDFGGYSQESGDSSAFILYQINFDGLNLSISGEGDV